MTELLEAVDALTLPQRSKVIQDDRTTSVIVPPLLTRLEDAIRSTIGGRAPSALASQRNILDSNALEKFMRITAMIESWSRDAGGRVDRLDPAGMLRSWYVAYTGRPHESDGFFVKQCWSWVREIESKLEPPRQWDLPDSCPVCGASSWWSPQTREQYPRPLVIEYPDGDPAMVQKGRAMCRACETVWSIRELAYQLEVQEGLHEQAG